MSITEEQFEYLFEEVSQAEDVVRLHNPEFVSGFHAISMQGHRLEFTIERLRAVKTNLKDSEKILLANIAGLRSANPELQPKGTQYARRMLKDKPLWEKVVSAHSLDGAGQENIDPNLADGEDFNEGKPINLSEALKNMSARDIKVEFEQHDYILRHKLEGIKKVSTLMDRYLGILVSRLRKVETLEAIGMRWTQHAFEASDLGKIEHAQQEITDGSFDVKAITAVLNSFPDDFTRLCELDGISRGAKRKVEWVDDVETPATIKRSKSLNAKSTGCKARRTGTGKEFGYFPL